MKDTSERVREFYRRQGEQRERERIVKLLESHRDLLDEAANPSSVWRGIGMGIRSAIKLISEGATNVQTK
jgi:hypothetical protein